MKTKLFVLVFLTLLSLSALSELITFVPTVHAAPSYSWDDSTSTVTITGTGTVTWAALGTQDRSAVKAHKLHPRNEISGYEWETSPLKAPLDSDYEVRPLDDIALRLKITVQNLTVAGVLTTSGTDRTGTAQSEDISISANETYQTTKYFRTITQISDDGILTCKWQFWHDRWGIVGYNPSYPSDTYSYIFQGKIIVESGITFVPATTISRSYMLLIRTPPDGSSEAPGLQVNSGGIINLGKLENAESKSVSYGVFLTTTTSPTIRNNGGTLNFYGTSLCLFSNDYVQSESGSTTRVWGVQITGGQGFKGFGYDFFNILVNKNSYLINAGDKKFSGAINKVTATDVYGIVLGYGGRPSDVAISQLYSRRHTYVVSHVSSTTWFSSVYNLTDCDLDTWRFDFESRWTGKVWRKYSFDLTLTFPNGTNYQGANMTLRYYGNGGGTVGSWITNSTGQIPTQTVTMGYHNYTGGNTLYEFNPYNVKITANGYPTKEWNFTVVEQENWNIAIGEAQIDPVARFNNTITKVNPNQSVTFDGSVSYDPDGGDIIDYSWNFGDGNTTSGNYPTINHAWFTTGNYTITLTVTDDEGATDSFSWIIEVTEFLPPLARFIFTPNNPRINQPITFNASASYDADGYIVSYQWDFGDGNFSMGVIVNHTYAIAGVYNVTLTVIDNQSKTGTLSILIDVSPNLHPKARFTYSPSNPQPTQTVNFDASESQDYDGTIILYYWNFGDGANTTGVTPTHSFAKTGTFNVSLTVTDNDNTTNTFTQKITVSLPTIPPIPPVLPIILKAYDLIVLVKDQYRYPIENAEVQIYLDQKMLLEGKTDEFGAFTAKRLTASKTYTVKVTHNYQTQEQEVLLDEDKTLTFEYSLLSLNIIWRMLERNWLLMALLFAFALVTAVSWQKTWAIILFFSALITVFIADYQMFPLQFKLLFVVAVIVGLSIIFKSLRQ